MVLGALLVHFALLPIIRGPIDFDSKGAAVGQILERLATETGTKLRAAPKLAEEIVFIHVKQTEVGDLKTRLADTLSATWIKDGDTEVLTRLAAQEKAIWNRHIAYRRKLVDETLKEIQKKLESPFDAKGLATGLANLPSEEDVRDDQAAAVRRYQAETALFAKGPLARLIGRLVLACSPNDLAALGPFERRVFRLKPNAMQYGFDSAKYARAMATYAQEQQAWIDESAKVNFKPNPNGRMVSDPRSQTEIGTTIPSLSLEVSRGEMTSLFVTNLVSENMEPFGYRVLAQEAYADPARKFMNSQMTPGPVDAKDPIVELSADSKEFQTRMMEAFRSRKTEPLSPRMKELILGVVKNDPLGWAASDVLLTYARMNKVNLVAALPDLALARTLSMSGEKEIRVHQVMRALVDSGTMELIEKEGWASMMPTDAYEAALDFTPRGAVVDLMKSVLSTGRLDIRDYARYAYNSKRLNRGGLGDWFLALYDRSVLGTSDRTDWKALQLYGSFSPEQQNELESGIQFQYSGMGPEQRKTVDRFIFSDRVGRVDRNAAGAVTSSNDRAIDPTDLLPTGTPDRCMTSAKVDKEPVIVAYSRGSDGKTRPARHVDPWTLATIESEIVGNPERMAQYGVANLAGYWTGFNKAIDLRVQVSPTSWRMARITVPEYNADATPVTWDKLPDPFRKAIEAAIAQYKANKSSQPGKIIPPVFR